MRCQVTSIIRIKEAATILAFASLAAADDEGGRIHADIVSLRSDGGNALCALFSSADAFPTKPDQAIRLVQSPILNHRAACDFVDIAPGTYAISVTHDANGNGKLDRNLLGMPTEGVGASNDARGVVGPPKFDAAKFTFDGGSLTLTITVRYL